MTSVSTGLEQDLNTSMTFRRVLGACRHTELRLQMNITKGMIFNQKNIFLTWIFLALYFFESLASFLSQYDNKLNVCYLYCSFSKKLVSGLASAVLHWARLLLRKPDWNAPLPISFSDSAAGKMGKDIQLLASLHSRGRPGSRLKLKEFICI